MSRPKKSSAPAGADPATEEPQVSTPIAASTVEMIALGRLVRAPENVRRAEEDVDVAEFANDIAGHGILQSLIGYEGGDASVTTSGGPFVFIVGGGRRLKALELLRERGAVTDHYLVPVQLRPQTEAVEISLAENLARRDMSPVDEFRAFKALMDLHPGAVGVRELASRFGYTEAHVRQRMRLADLNEEVLEALGRREITLDAAYAYATTQDPALQLKVFQAQQKETWKPHDPDRIKQAIAGVTYGENDPMVRFVTLAAYEAAGGRYEDDLFLGAGEERRLIDTALVERLAREVAEAAIGALVDQNKQVARGIFALSDNWGAPLKPKAPKGLVAVSTDWSFDADKLWSTAKKAKAEVTAIYCLDREGKLALHRGKIFIPKDKKAEIDKVRNTGRSPGYREPTPEERAAAEREREIAIWGPRLAMPVFAGTAFEGRAVWPQSHWPAERRDHAGFGDGYMVDVKIFVPAADVEVGQEATLAHVDALQREKQEREAAQRKTEEEKQAARAAALSEMDAQREQLLAEPPAVVRIIDAGADFFRQEDGSYPDVRSLDDDQPEHGFEALGELLAYYAKLIDSEIRHWATLAAYDEDGSVDPGTCRVCGCTEEAACVPVCSWADASRTLCTTAECLEATADERKVPEAA